MIMHTINAVKPYDGERLLLRFDHDYRPELTSLVDLSVMLAQGGVFSAVARPCRVFRGQDTFAWAHAGMACR
jgi:hypothetical protein